MSPGLSSAWKATLGADEGLAGHVWSRGAGECGSGNTRWKVQREVQVQGPGGEEMVAAGEAQAREWS